MKSTLMLLIAATVFGQAAHATPGALPKNHDLASQLIEIEFQIEGIDMSRHLSTIQREQLLNKEAVLMSRMQASDPDGYETLRSTMVDKAGNLESFLRWATPDEIADDAGLGEEDLIQELLDHSADGEQPVISINVHLASQKIDAHGGGLNITQHPIASARPGYVTPVGCHHPTLLQKLHWSRKYNAPMPNSVFFIGGVALHQGPLNVRSHGCVHLSAADSASIYQAVTNAGKGETLICVSAK